MDLSFRVQFCKLPSQKHTPMGSEDISDTSDLLLVKLRIALSLLFPFEGLELADKCKTLYDPALQVSKYPPYIDAPASLAVLLLNSNTMPVSLYGIPFGVSGRIWHG